MLESKGTCMYNTVKSLTGTPMGTTQSIPLIEVNVNVNVSVYSLKSPLSSADFTIYAPGIGTLSYTVSSPLGRIQHLRNLLQL